MKTSTLFNTKKLLLVVCFCASVSFLNAQTFSILPSNTRNINLPCDSLTPHGDTVYIQNLTSNTMKLSYVTTLVQNLPDEDNCWTYMLCDWELCRPGIPRDTIHPDELIPANSQHQEMAFDMITYNIKGQGKVMIKIFETNNPSNFQIVTWNITGCTTGDVCSSSGIFETKDNSRFTVYPNPAEGFITMELVKGYHKPIGSVQIYNLVGEMLLEYNGIRSNTLKMDVSKLPAGAYFIKRNDTDGVSVKQFFKVK